MDFDNIINENTFDETLESVDDNQPEPNLDSELNELDTLPMDFMDLRLDDISYVRKLIEAILLMSPEPIVVRRIASSLGIKNALAEKATEALCENFTNRGMIIQKIGDGIQLGTDPDVAEHLEKFFQMEKRRRISRAGLQTLAIIAYNQPVTRAEIESFRGGINSGGVIQSLLERDLIKIAGRKETPGNPFLYSVSDDFLKYFGLKNVDELKAKLPAIEDEIARDGNITQLKLKDMGILQESDKSIPLHSASLSSDDLQSDSIINNNGENETNSGDEKE